jgi:hypothetical protein
MYYNQGERRGLYIGDRHPDCLRRELPASAWEDAPRKCENCGAIAVCLKEYRDWKHYWQTFKPDEMWLI